MLKKKLCQRCRNDQSKSYEYIERMWEEGYVYCPTEYLEKDEWKSRRIIREPPEKCPFLLEHILMNQKIKRIKDD